MGANRELCSEIVLPRSINWENSRPVSVICYEYDIIWYYELNRFLPSSNILVSSCTLSQFPVPCPTLLSFLD